MKDGRKIRSSNIVLISIIIILFMEITIQQNIPGTDWLFTSVIMRREKKKVKYAKMKQKLKSIFIITL